MPILDEETFQAFGYRLSAVTPGMAKKVVCACNKCSRIFAVIRKNLNANIWCRPCSFSSVPRDSYTRGVAKRKKTCVDRYGQEVKPVPASTAEARKRTNLERFGVVAPQCSPAIREKTKATNLARHGVEHVQSLPSVKKKARATMLARYGVEHTLQSPILYAKAVATWVKKYGVTNPTLNKNVRWKVATTTVERFGSLTPRGYGKAQQEVADALPKTLTVQNGSYLLPSGREIDIFIPEKKTGIEYCGLYMHHERSPTPRLRNYHRNKMREAQQQGIQLITLFEDEWLHRTEQVTAALHAKLGVFETILGARECSLVELPADLARTFIEKHHIQEAPKLVSRAWGLRQGEALRAVLAVRHDYQNKERAVVLNRLCFAQGVQIHGGAARLFQALVTWARLEGFNRVVTWSDNRWSQGKLYQALGFSLARDGAPDYAYVKIGGPKGIRIPKKSRQKSKIGCPEGLTEYEYNLEQGFARIWDCGHRRWEFVL